jgi:hypothetical protein
MEVTRVSGLSVTEAGPRLGSFVYWAKLEAKNQPTVYEGERLEVLLSR